MFPQRDWFYSGPDNEDENVHSQFLSRVTPLKVLQMREDIIAGERALQAERQEELFVDGSFDRSSLNSSALICMIMSRITRARRLMTLLGYDSSLSLTSASLYWHYYTPRAWPILVDKNLYLYLRNRGQKYNQFVEK